MIKNLPTIQKTQVHSLGREELLEKGMSTHSSILIQEFHGQRSLMGYSPWNHRVRHSCVTNTSVHIYSYNLSQGVLLCSVLLVFIFLICVLHLGL